MTIWYVAQEVGSTGIYVYDHTVEQEVQPEHSSAWAVPEAGPGSVAYLTPIGGWHVLPDFRIGGLKSVIALALAQAELKFSAVVYELHKRYPVPERATWPQQVLEAYAYAKGDLDPGPMIAKVAEALGTNPREHARTVIRKHVTYTEKMAKALAEFKAEQRSIESAKSIAELPPVLTYDSLVQYYT